MNVIPGKSKYPSRKSCSDALEKHLFTFLLATQSFINRQGNSPFSQIPENFPFSMSGFTVRLRLPETEATIQSRFPMLRATTHSGK
ncbi:MAG: hypothetical protein R3C59_07605 [Planctomycetaceae bacterium]